MVEVGVEINKIFFESVVCRVIGIEDEECRS